MSRIDFKLYLITDRHLADDILNASEEALKGGLKALQLREKDMATRPLLELAYRMRELTACYGARLFINDRVDVAVAVDADGVHLGQSSMPVYVVKKTWPELLLGVSCHNISEAIAAEQGGADFITLGPVYETPSKIKYGPPVGLDMLRAVRAEVSLPVFAIGGIKVERVREVISAGADGVAVISGILASSDVKGKTIEYTRALI